MAEKAVQQFCKKRENITFIQNLEIIIFDCAKCGGDFSARDMAQIFVDSGYNNLPFTADEFLRYLQF